MCLDLYWILSWLVNYWPSGGQKHSEGGVSRAPSQRKFVWSFFFKHALRHQFETWYLHLVGRTTHQVRVSSQSGHPDLLNSQEWVKAIFLHLWPQKLYRAFRFDSLWPISCSYLRHSQLTRHSLMLANGRIRQSLTALVSDFRNKKWRLILLRVALKHGSTIFRIKPPMANRNISYHMMLMACCVLIQYSFKENRCNFQYVSVYQRDRNRLRQLHILWYIFHGVILDRIIFSVESQVSNCVSVIHCFYSWFSFWCDEQFIP